MSAVSDLHWEDLIVLGEKINAVEFDSAFDLDQHGILTRSEHPVPEVLDIPDDINSLEILGPWTALSGMTGQHGYNGPCMHTSEFIGGGIAHKMLGMVRESDLPALTFAVVEIREESGDFPDGDPIGWAIIVRDVDESAVSRVGQ